MSQTTNNEQTETAPMNNVKLHATEIGHERDGDLRALFIGGPWSCCLRSVNPGTKRIEWPDSESGRCAIYHRKRIWWAADNGLRQQLFVFVAAGKSLTNSQLTEFLQVASVKYPDYFAVNSDQDRHQ